MKEYMKSPNNIILNWVLLLQLPVFLTSNVAAEETIIQQEKISFEKCLKVITTSQDKLLVPPKITDVTDQKRVAVFTLADGTITITCDGEDGNVTVSTNTN